jgi:heptosyltransferase-3
MKNQSYQISQYGNYPDLTKVRKILVVKMRHLGDVLLSTPVFNILKSFFPMTQIDALIYEDTFAMLEGTPFIENYFLPKRTYPSFLKKIISDFSLYRKIRKQKYDLVINLTEGDRGALCAFFSKAKIKVGYKDNKKGFVGKEKIFTHVVKTPLLPRHRVEVDIDALRRIGLFPKEEDKELHFFISQDSKQKVLSLLKENGIEKNSFIVIHPVSRWKFKCWNDEYVAHLIDEIAMMGIKVILTASNDPQERAKVDRIQQLTRFPALNFSGKLSLKELGALIDMSMGIVTVDSVTLHIASALKKPTVVLFGPSSEFVWGPWKNPLAKIIRHNISCRPCGLDGCGGSKRSECLEKISVNEVLDSLKSLLNLEKV